MVNDEFEHKMNSPFTIKHFPLDNYFSSLVKSA